MATTALTAQNYFSTSLSAPLSTSDTTVYLTLLPTGNEGYLEIDEGTAQREIVYFTSKGANFVTLPSVGAGRGVGGTAAAAHTTGAVVKQKINVEYWKELQNGNALADGSITNSKLAANTAWTSWTPTLTNISVGTTGAVNQGYYQQIGKTVRFRLYLKGGTGAACTGSTVFSLPVTAKTLFSTGDIIGQTKVMTFHGPCVLNDTSTAIVRWYTTSGSGQIESNTGATSPATFTNGQEIYVIGSYEAA